MPGSASRVGVDPVLLLDRDPGQLAALARQLGRKLRHLGVQLGEAAQQVLGRLAGTDQPVVDAQDPQPGAGSMTVLPLRRLIEHARHPRDACAGM